MSILASGDLIEVWPLLSDADRLEGFRDLDPPEAERLFDALESRDRAWIVGRLPQSEQQVALFKRLSRSEAEGVFGALESASQLWLLQQLPEGERRLWLRWLAPDDTADLIQETEGEERESLLNLLDAGTRKEVTGLLAYEEDAAGGLMNPRYLRLRPNITVDAAITYLRHQSTGTAENFYYPYVLDREKLIGVISLRELLAANSDALVREVMKTDLITVREDTDQEELADRFAETDLMVIPVVDDEGRIKGIVTVDDIVDVVREEATEDIHKLGGAKALETTYMQASVVELWRARIGWLALLLVLSFFSAQAVAAFSPLIAHLAVLSALMPLIISSGGNSGSQAATLLVRALALGEVSLPDISKVIRREIGMGLLLGLSLGLIAFVGMTIWSWVAPGAVGDSLGLRMRVCLVAGLSVVAVVTWGILVGSMLPFALKRLSLDPASASAPLVATIVDVTGLLIYFSIARLMLSGPAAA